MNSQHFLTLSSCKCDIYLQQFNNKKDVPRAGGAEGQLLVVLVQSEMFTAHVVWPDLPS